MEAYARIGRFHELQHRDDLWLATTDPGITLGVKTTPLSRVGIYVPGGRASYPTTLLMCAIPAVVAGCKRDNMLYSPASQSSYACGLRYYRDR